MLEIKVVLTVDAILAPRKFTRYWETRLFLTGLDLGDALRTTTELSLFRYYALIGWS